MVAAATTAAATIGGGYYGRLWRRLLRRRLLRRRLLRRRLLRRRLLRRRLCGGGYGGKRDGGYSFIADPASSSYGPVLSVTARLSLGAYYDIRRIRDRRSWSIIAEVGGSGVPMLRQGIQLRRVDIGLFKDASDCHGDSGRLIGGGGQLSAPPLPFPRLVRARWRRRSRNIKGVLLFRIKFLRASDAEILEGGWTCRRVNEVTQQPISEHILVFRNGKYVAIECSYRNGLEFEGQPMKFRLEAKASGKAIAFDAASEAVSINTPRPRVLEADTFSSAHLRPDNSVLVGYSLTFDQLILGAR